MADPVNTKAIYQQSKNAYDQWCVRWRKQAKHHSKYKMKSLEDLRNSGVGKVCLLVANGYSFEENIDVIKKHKDNIDIMACDKTLGHLLDNGIKPKYVLICDACVDYEKYMEKWKDQLDETIAIVNVCANPKWADNGNWKDLYFFINMDIMKNEIEFQEISGCSNMIPAATNVSNAMVVMLTQSDNKGRNNFFGYDKICLTGFDYSWRNEGNYYAFDEHGMGKRWYMKHMYLQNLEGDWINTSNNLLFSAQWLEKYIRTFNLPIVQCSGKGIMPSLFRGALDEHLDYRYNIEDNKKIGNLNVRRHRLLQEAKILEDELRKIGYEHHEAFVASL